MPAVALELLAQDREDVGAFGEQGQLKWCDPETGRYIATYDDQVTRADHAEVRADEAEAELRVEREARTALEARVRELEAQLRHRDS